MDLSTAFIIIGAIIAIITFIITATVPALVIGALTIIVSLNIFARPHEVRTWITEACEAVRHENITHCRECNKTKALDEKTKSLDGDINRIEGYVQQINKNLDDMKTLILQNFNK